MSKASNFDPILLAGRTATGDLVPLQVNVDGTLAIVAGPSVPGASNVTMSTVARAAIVATITTSLGNVLAANPLRLGFQFRNSSANATIGVFYGALPQSPALTVADEIITPGGVLRNTGWVGTVSAIWSAADGSNGLVAEFTA